MTFGYGIRYEDTISSQLENLLDGKYQVINAGIPGYNFNQWEALGEALAASVKPRIVVAVVNANDSQARFYPVQGGATISRFRSYPWETQFREDTGQRVSQERSLLGWIFGHLASGFSLTRILETPPANDNTTAEVYARELKQINYYNSPSPEATALFNEASGSLAQFSNRINSGGATVVFAFFPYRVTALQPTLGVDQRFADLADSIKVGPMVGVVGLTTLLTEDRFFIPGDPHTSKLGNYVIAKALADKILAMVH